MQPLGCLILHGFAGDVHEVLPLALHLKEAGYVVECPTLAGHGHTRRSLAKTSRHDWIASAEEAYKRLAMRVEKIVLIGFSMGGLLACQVAAKHPAELLITLNTPYYYWDVQQALRNVKIDFRSHVTRYLKGLTRIPVSSMLQFRQLLAETKALMAQVSCPSLILQGQRDDTVQAISADALRQHLGSQQSETVYFPNSGHLLLHSPDAQEAVRTISAALEKLTVSKA